MRSRVAPPPLFLVGEATTGRTGNPPSAAVPPSRTAPGNAAMGWVDPSAARARLSQVAHTRLGRSANRIDEMLESTAAQGLSIGAAIERVRTLSIRGVLPATLSALADELALASRAGSSAAGERRPHRQG